MDPTYSHQPDPDREPKASPWPGGWTQAGDITPSVSIQQTQGVDEEINWDMLQGQAKEKKKKPLEKYGNASHLPATLDMETAGGKWDLYHWKKEEKSFFFPQHALPYLS